MISVYLAGGFKSRWQDSVKQNCHEAVFFDPSTHGIQSPHLYTKWDLDAIAKCDVVFAYIERDNPGGYALALEIGYAKALKKYIILVEEHADEKRERAFAMIRETCNEVTCVLQEGISSLQTVIMMDDTDE